ncbi:Transcriptional regulatory protein DegU [Baekduia alba]|uniref:response regulator n=1 Tax=Baekduia alba TaxID=2997333 RepID=UPI0023410BDB|nr:response regulator transcription factor [Baekduia alba]WCB93387.1 Transcriptional regulatory protein DegU [Baekduia alba]
MSIEDPVRVVLADDHALTRRGLRRLLDGDDRIAVVAEANDLAAVARDVEDLAPRVLVIDLGMSNGTSIEAIRRLRRRVPGTEIVVLTMEDSTAFAQATLASGARGFVVKHDADGELTPAVLSAARGEEYVSVRVADRLAALRRTPAA